ncbi:hypothetical protein PV10_01026 [Exophiala mesophila]|uniref:Phosphatidic acid phosphatase type 2/haloperoxidase domain-containing protein n=1 Tax=Exophiala mesophila TaxID=212818 RepID=A0A0D1X624_EXOME|nr:uncharacterized protein PV10_01026 [Exophiala mesophila]KIV97255.1 hypothetical protein PV10_01026 [Exophiala mesophila]
MASIKPDRTTLPRLLHNLKIFILDSWFDVVCILVIAGITGVIWVIEARPNRLFPLLSPDGTTYAPEISYPYLTNVFSSLGAGLVCAIIPVGVMILSQFFIHSFADASSGILGLFYSLVTGTCFQVILKKSIGGLRPHFLAVCQPRIPDGVLGQGFNGILYSVDQVCTGDPGRINNALQSFPSGHSEIAFAGLGYLAIYLFAHLKMGDGSRVVRTGFWRMVIVMMPLLLATYLACTLVLRYHHHAFDCFFGALIGIVTAVLGYRSAYRSVFDGTTNYRPRLGRRMKREVDREETRVADEEHALGDIGPADLEMGSGGGGRRDVVLDEHARRSHSEAETLY